MKRRPESIINLELGFADKDRTLSLLNLLSKDGTVAVNIMRARITEDSAWLVLELCGEESRVLDVAKLLTDAASVNGPVGPLFSRAS
jgi:hypothetical protein